MSLGRVTEPGVGGDEGCVIGTEWQRQVHVGAFAGTRADLVGVAGKVRVVGARLGMHGTVERIAAVVEDGLRASPWWVSKSRMATRWNPRRNTSAAMAALFRKQKPE